MKLTFFILDNLLVLTTILTITSCSSPMGVDVFDQGLADIMRARAGIVSVIQTPTTTTTIQPVAK